MSLRQAKFDDHWRHTYSRTYNTKFAEITVANLNCFANTSIGFSSGLNAIVGANGVGKSTLASAITQLLSDDPNTVEQAFHVRLAGSSIDGIAHSEGTQLNLSVRDDGSGRRVTSGDKFTGEFTWLDPSATAARYVDQFHKDTNFKDLLDQVTPLKVERDFLEMASYLVGKDYTEIFIYEISDYAGLERFPYFRVTASGVTYNSEGMGRGELSLLLTYWTLLDMSKDSILILEEPETHVSPRSQDCLMNAVAKFCDEKGIWAIVTTHSPTVIQRIPKEHIKFLVRANGAAAPISAAMKLDIALLLGGGVAFRGIILVEDESAKEFARTILEKIDPELQRQLEIVSVGSESRITGLLKTMPKTGGWLTLIGAYDGNMRGLIDPAGFNWPFDFLPGSLDPDQLLKNLHASVPNMVNVLSAELQKTTEQIQVALNHVAGVDYHDYFITFSEPLNVEPTTVRRAFARVWLQNGENQSAANAFIEGLRQSLKDPA